MSDEELHHAREMFSVFDEDGSGTVSHSEFRQCTRLMQVHLDDGQFDEIMEDLDPTQSGEIEFQSFQKWWHHFKHTTKGSVVRAMTAAAP